MLWSLSWSDLHGVQKASPGTLCLFSCLPMHMNVAVIICREVGTHILRSLASNINMCNVTSLPHTLYSSTYQPGAQCCIFGREVNIVHTLPLNLQTMRYREHHQEVLRLLRLEQVLMQKGHSLPYPPIPTSWRRWEKCTRYSTLAPPSPSLNWGYSRESHLWYVSGSN